MLWHRQKGRVVRCSTRSYSYLETWEGVERDKEKIGIESLSHREIKSLYLFSEKIRLLLFFFFKLLAPSQENFRVSQQKTGVFFYHWVVFPPPPPPPPPLISLCRSRRSRCICIFLWTHSVVLLLLLIYCYVIRRLWIIRSGICSSFISTLYRTVCTVQVAYAVIILFLSHRMYNAHAHAYRQKKTTSAQHSTTQHIASQLVHCRLEADQ